METSMDRILKLLAQESPLSPKLIGERLNIPATTVRSLLSQAKSLGAVDNYKGI